MDQFISQGGMIFFYSWWDFLIYFFPTVIWSNKLLAWIKLRYIFFIILSGGSICIHLFSIISRKCGCQIYFSPIYIVVMLIIFDHPVWLDFFCSHTLNIINNIAGMNSLIYFLVPCYLYGTNIVKIKHHLTL